MIALVRVVSVIVGGVLYLSFCSVVVVVMMVCYWLPWWHSGGGDGDGCCKGGSCN